jgi:microcystin-dependent protein
MPTTSSDRGLSVPTNAGDNGTWGTELITTLTALDSILGGMTTFVSSASASSTITSSQAQTGRIQIAGTSTWAYSLTLPQSNYAMGRYQVDYWDVNSCVVKSTVSGGRTVTLGANQSMAIVSDGTNIDPCNTSLIPSGSVIAYASATPPGGWIECNGASLSWVNYPTLWLAVGLTWGGTSSQAFLLPDLRGAFVRGWDHGRGLDTNTSSRAFATYEGDGFASHTHANYFSDPGHQHSFFAAQSGSGGYAGGGFGAFTTYTSNTSYVGTGGYITNAAAGSNETNPKNYALMYIIKT